MGVEHTKNMAVIAIAQFNTRQLHTTDWIDSPLPGNLTVVDENTVVLDTTRERALISRRVGGEFEVVGRQFKM